MKNTHIQAWTYIADGWLSIFEGMKTFMIYPPQKDPLEEIKEIEKEFEEEYKKDTEALRNDWKKIGGDLRKVMGTLKK